MDPTLEPTANADRPIQATRAVQLLFASFAIGLITAAFHLRQRTSGVPMLLALLIVIAFFGLGFLLAWRISARSNWARIILLVVVLFGLPFAIMANLTELKRSTLSGSLSLLITILQLLGTYLLFTRNSNLWFRSRK
jgi:disulfide bond formation protein DsbB